MVSKASVGALLAVGAALAAAVGPAAAVDDTKPTAACGYTFEDADGDQANTQVPAADMTPATELLNGFIKYDAAKGDQAATYNLTVKNLSTAVPTGYTTLTWSGYYTTADGTAHFVRAIVDFGGGTAFEYGAFTPNPTGVGVTGVNQYQGDTPGKFFTGPNGVIQMVIPAAKSGDKYTAAYAVSTQGRTLPSSAKTPSRGLAPIMDTAPDDGADAGASATVAPCGGATSVLPVTTPISTPVTDAPSQPNNAVSSEPTGRPTLKVAVLTKTFRVAKGHKTIALKVRSAESVTALAAQLRLGRTVYAKGKLAKVDGAGALKLKLSRKLKKGTYALDLAGTDVSGRRVVATYGVKVK